MMRRGSAFERIFKASKDFDSTGISFHKVASEAELLS